MEILENRIIHYEDNIFYLKLLLNNLKKIEKLNVNLELFQSKLKDDMSYIYTTCQMLYSSLLKNDKLIIKNEQIHSILTLKCLYNQISKMLISKNLINENDLIEYIDQNNKDITTINNKYLDTEENKEDITTNEELNILFMDDDIKEE